MKANRQGVKFRMSIADAKLAAENAHDILSHILSIIMERKRQHPKVREVKDKLQRRITRAHPRGRDDLHLVVFHQLTLQIQTHIQLFKQLVFRNIFT